MLEVKRFAFFTVVKIHALVFRVVTPCGDEVEYKRFGGPCCLLLHLENGSSTTTR
jgi:hypothetical protein